MIHGSSVIDKKAKIGKDVKVGPFCYVGPKVQISDSVQLISNIHPCKYYSRMYCIPMGLKCEWSRHYPICKYYL